MTEPRLPSTAPSVPSYAHFRRELLRASRFLGVSQFVWGVLLGSLLLLWVSLRQPEMVLWWCLPCVLLGWGIVELAFLPRRREASMLARYQSRQEIARIAMQQGVGLSQVKVDE